MIINDAARRDEIYSHNHFLSVRPSKSYTMPYLLISCQITLDGGVTNVGDKNSDSALMGSLDAFLCAKLGSTPYYESPHAPRTVLNKLEKLGYRVIASSGIGQTCEGMPTGLTKIGDNVADADKSLMKHLDASVNTSVYGNENDYYETKLTPNQVLNKLQQRGFHVVASSGLGQTCVWTLYKQ
uniref:GTP cyclohydrolase 1 feedback regulatory protein n=1 Tax=Strigamia maritima TaxID=126957 RepID=T1J688_STRMM